MFLRQVQICSHRLLPSVANVISTAVSVSASVNGIPNSAKLQVCRSIGTKCSWTPVCCQTHSCYCRHRKDRVASVSQGMQSLACRKYASSSSTNTSKQPQQKVYKLMRIKAKDFEKVNPDVYFEGVEPSMIQAEFDESKELEDANEMVRKLFSLEVANQRQISEKQVKVLNKKVQLDPEKENKDALLVVTQTVIIRSYSRRLQSYEHRKDVGTKVKLIHLIDKRRKVLKRLRKQNYAQFEKLKKELGIDYHQFGRYEYYSVSRRMKEKDDIIKVARKQKTVALKEYMETVRKPQLLLEIAQLKRDLGKELTEEEQEQLREREEIERDLK